MTEPKAVGEWHDAVARARIAASHETDVLCDHLERLGAWAHEQEARAQRERGYHATTLAKLRRVQKRLDGLVGARDYSKVKMKAYRAEVKRLRGVVRKERDRLQFLLENTDRCEDFEHLTGVVLPRMHKTLAAALPAKRTGVTLTWAVPE